jgi:hypothetical protein
MNMGWIAGKQIGGLGRVLFGSSVLPRRCCIHTSRSSLVCQPPNRARAENALLLYWHDFTAIPSPKPELDS